LFQDGWLRTGDLGTLDALGFMTIHDRAKDAVKSGGEWISSIALEAAISAHPQVSEVAVIATPDPRWQERPLAIVVARPGATLDLTTLPAFLGDRVARWWIPDHWAVVPSLPKMGTGKIDKMRLRAMREAGELPVTIIDRMAVPASQER
jgi:fatty-acyl-CoA synthase